MNTIRIRSKIWLEVDGEPFLGDGRYHMLTAIERCGSINGAAKVLGISYRKIWAQLQAMEEHAPFKLLERRTGGIGGGETKLTPAIQDLLRHYQLLRKQVNQAADLGFKEIYIP
ncbi:molybdate transport system regulatory protein [Desulfuromusa kysingii]|uniref:Molybdate transport system regulatory protein n=1 Tax=Desulfuromusa kysingii TaxID=37625 RepID=A0A1H4DS66_9BACT|nr:LysR family transcriptional regulator [Desulfuromusa kysingii]SEA75032.1 molybdate transport system regulatory protein [Desulfuromusa kysingii]